MYAAPPSAFVDFCYQVRCQGGNPRRGACFLNFHPVLLVLLSCFTFTARVIRSRDTALSPLTTSGRTTSETTLVLTLHTNLLGPQLLFEYKTFFILP
jgi:hypothetical protein